MQTAKYEIRDRGEFGWQAIETYGEYMLSIIAGPTCYSEPRAKLPSIEQYTNVEIAIMINDDFVSDEFLTQFGEMFEGDKVASYVTWQDVNIVRKRLELLACS